jgi:exopolysaccharide biosynthesis polyprenyl glycosylphosphotransferase
MKYEVNDSLARNLDFACVIAAFAAASGLATILGRFGLFIWPGIPGRTIYGWPPDYVIFLIVSLVLWAAASAGLGVHNVNHIESPIYSYWRLVRTLLIWMGVTGTMTFLLKLQTVSRQFSLSFATIASGLIVTRQFAEVHLAARRSPQTRRTAIVVGSKRESEWLSRILSARPEWRGSVRKLDLNGLRTIIERNRIGDEPACRPDDTEFFIVPGTDDMAAVEQCALELLKQSRVVHMVPAIIDAALFRHSLGDVGGVPLITLEPGRLSSIESVLKRAMDVIVTALLLIPAAPVLALVALVVKLTSRGPILFSQQRLGRNGVPFTIYKFRTMRVDAESLLKSSPELYKKYVDNNFKLPDGEDFRVTPIGRFLRGSSLDELPQLFNVLWGDMSIVGPRPIVPAEIEKYGEYGALLLSVKPGMTGQWQVNGRSNIIEYSHRVRLDMEYIRDQSLRGDVEIIVKTVSAVSRMEGAH